MNIQENTVYTKYLYMAPKHGRLSRKQIHKLFQEYEKHPERKAMLIKKAREMSIKKNNMYKKLLKKKKSIKRRRN